MVINYFAGNWFTIVGQLIIPLHFTNNILGVKLAVISVI